MNHFNRSGLVSWNKYTLVMMTFLFLAGCQNQLASRNDLKSEPPVIDSTNDQELASPGPALETAGQSPDAGESKSDWPTFRLNNQHTAASGRGTVLEEPSLLWRFDTRGVVESSPAIVDDVLYVGTFNRAMYAIDIANGDEIWRFPVGGLLRSSASVVNDIVYFGADDNRLYAVDVQTGAELGHSAWVRVASNLHLPLPTESFISAPLIGTSTR